MGQGQDFLREHLKCRSPVARPQGRRGKRQFRVTLERVPTPRGRRPWNLNRVGIRFHGARARGGGTISAGVKIPVVYGR